MMGSCGSYDKDFEALVDGALSAEARDRLFAHLEDCPGCREEYAWLTGAQRALENMGDALAEGLPQIDLAEAVMQAVSEATVKQPEIVPFPKEKVRVRTAAPWRRWAGVAAAAAASAVLASWFAMNGLPLGTPDSGSQQHAMAPEADTGEPVAPVIHKPTEGAGAPVFEATTFDEADKLLAVNTPAISARRSARPLRYGFGGADNQGCNRSAERVG